MKTATDKALDRVENICEKQTYKIAHDARIKYVIPFCEKNGCKFVAGMGGWAFTWREGKENISDWNSEKLPKRLLAVLQAETFYRANNLGSLMADYTPKNY